jgi:hypothetical protein
MCELAQQQLGWEHLSAGDLLRAERKAGGPNAELIEEFIQAGKVLCPSCTVVGAEPNGRSVVCHVGCTTVCASADRAGRDHRQAVENSDGREDTDWRPVCHYMPQPLVELYGGCMVVQKIS